MGLTGVFPDAGGCRLAGSGLARLLLQDTLVADPAERGGAGGRSRQHTDGYTVLAGLTLVRRVARLLTACCRRVAWLLTAFCRWWRIVYRNMQ